jgi:hypothetical protein
LHLALETPQCIFQRLTLLNDDFCHLVTSPQFRSKLATLQSLAFAGSAHFKYRMPSHARSLFAHGILPHFYAVLRTLLRFMGCFYSIPHALSSNLCDLSHFSASLQIPLTLLPIPYPPHHLYRCAPPTPQHTFNQPVISTGMNRRIFFSDSFR